MVHCRPLLKVLCSVPSVPSCNHFHSFHCTSVHVLFLPSYFPPSPNNGFTLQLQSFPPVTTLNPFHSTSLSALNDLICPRACTFHSTQADMPAIMEEAQVMRENFSTWNECHYTRQKLELRFFPIILCAQYCRNSSHEKLSE